MMNLKWYVLISDMGQASVPQWAGIKNWKFFQANLKCPKSRIYKKVIFTFYTAFDCFMRDSKNHKNRSLI